MNLVSVLEVSLFHSLVLPTKENAFSFPFDSIGDLRVPIASNGSIDSLNLGIAGMAPKSLRVSIFSDPKSAIENRPMMRYRSQTLSSIEIR